MQAERMKIQEIELTKQLKDKFSDAESILLKNNWKVVGSGAEGAVGHPLSFKKKNKPYVIKLFFQSSAYKLFVEFVRQHQTNPHLPKFSKYTRDLPGGWSYVAMEELKPLSNISGIIPEIAALYVAGNVHQIHSLGPTLFYRFDMELEKKNIQVVDVLEPKNLQKVFRVFGHTPSQEWMTMVNELCEFAKNHNILILDTNRSNMMLRGSTLVMTDPFIN